MCHEREARPLGAHVGGPDVGEGHVAAAALDRVGALRGDGHERGHLALEVLALRRAQDALDVGAAEVHHGGATLAEDLELACEVILERGVLDGRDVVGADVQEGGDVELDAQRAVVLERLARDLHHHGVEAGVTCVGEVAPEVGGLGRGVGRLGVLDAVVGVDGSDDAAGLASVCSVDDVSEHVGRGRLALGARDAHLGKRAVGVAERCGGDEGHRGAHVARDDGACTLRHLGKLVQAGRLADVGHGTLLERGREVGRLEGASLAEEDVARLHEARVAGGAGHGRVGRELALAREDAALVEELDELGEARVWLVAGTGGCAGGTGDFRLSVHGHQYTRGRLRG